MSELDELFPPAVGGAVESHRRTMQREQEQLSRMEQDPEAFTGQYAAIRIRELGAEMAQGRTLVVATGGSFATGELFGQDINRKYAVLMALDEPVVICFSQQAADDPRCALAGTAAQNVPGFVLPVNVPVPITYQGVIWYVATSATASRLSTMAFSFSEKEKPHGM